MKLREFLRLGVIIGTLPNTIANGQAIDAVPVMADLNWIVSQVNANGATASSVATIQALINTWGPLTTFTPALTFGGLSVGITYNAGGTKGWWTSIAGIIFVWFQVILTNKGSSVGFAALTNMPVTVNAAFNGDTPIGVVVGGQLTYADRYLGLTPFPSTNTFAIASTPGAGGAGPNFLDNTAFVNTSSVFGFAIYPQ